MNEGYSLFDVCICGIASFLVGTACGIYVGVAYMPHQEERLQTIKSTPVIEQSRTSEKGLDIELEK